LGCAWIATCSSSKACNDAQDLQEVLVRANIAAVVMAATLTVTAATVTSAQTPGPGPASTPTTVVRTERDDTDKLGLLGLLGLTGLLGLRRRKAEHVETAGPVPRTVGTTPTRN
jgi:hypothetical protein